MLWIDNKSEFAVSNETPNRRQIIVWLNAEDDQLIANMGVNWLAPERIEFVQLKLFSISS